MPRSTSDPAVKVLSYFREQPFEVARTIFGLVKEIVAARTPVVEGKRRKARGPKPVVAEPAFSQAHGLSPTAQVTLMEDPPEPKQRKRRMRADSARPAREDQQSKPIMPPADEGGDDTNDNAAE